MLVPCGECGTESEGYRLASRPPCNKRGKPCIYCGNLREVDKRIAEARKMLEGLVEERGNIMSHFNKHHDPVASLPTEIMAAIFGLFIPTASTVRRDKNWCCNQLATPPQFVLGSVCRTWRHIIFGTPTFWTALNLRIGDWATSHRAGLVKEWLERSAQLPISLCLVAQFNGRRARTRALQLLADVLNEYLSNCKTLHYLFAPCRFGAMLRMEEGSSRLEELSLRLPDSHGGFHTGWQVFDAPTALPLKSLSVENYSLSGMGARWEGLTSLTANISEQADWEALGLCHSLQWLAVVFEARIHACTHYTFLHLTYLHFTQPPLYLFNKLTLPRLQRLDIISPDELWDKLPDIGGLVQRSQCVLEHLLVDYDDNFVPPECVVSFLQEIPTLTTLFWAAPLCSVFTEHFSRTMFWKAGSLGPFLPNLTSFSYYSHRTLLPWSAIGTLIPLQPPSPNMSRRPLSKVHFTLDLDPTDEMADQDGPDIAIVNAKMSQDDLTTLTEMIANAGIAEFCVEEKYGLDLIHFWTVRYASIASSTDD